MREKEAAMEGVCTQLASIQKVAARLVERGGKGEREREREREEREEREEEVLSE